MLDTYIKNRGMTKTIIHNNNHNTINEANWDADYDGSVANISLDLSKNGKNNHFDFQLNNNDLANILTIPSVSQPIHKRLKMDFKKPDSFNQIFLEIDPESDSDSDSEEFIDLNRHHIKSSPVQNILTHLSSPKTNEEFIMPFQNYSLQDYNLKPVTIIHKPSSHNSKKTKKHKKYRKTSSHRVRHHNYPSTRKSRRHTSRRKSKI